jgi:hypothetical protein
MEAIMFEVVRKLRAIIVATRARMSVLISPSAVHVQWVVPVTMTSVIAVPWKEPESGVAVVPVSVVVMAVTVAQPEVRQQG